MSELNGSLSLIWCRLLLICSLTLLSGCSEEKSPQALGTLERDRITLLATASEVIAEIAVEEGVFVEKGQLLLKLDDRKQRAVFDKARAGVKSAEARLTELLNGARPEEIAAAKARMNKVTAELAEAEKNFIRTETLVQKNLQSEAELDAARARKGSLAATLLDAREQLQLLENGTRIEVIQQAKGELERAKANLRLEERNLEELSIYATRKGRLDSLPRHLGERVNAGTPLAVLLANEAPYARVYIPEQSRLTVIVGRELAVHIDGIEEPFIGTVRWVSHEPAFTPHYALNEKERSRLVYLAEVQLPESASVLPSGMAVQVDLSP